MGQTEKIHFVKSFCKCHLYVFRPEKTDLYIKSVGLHATLLSIQALRKPLETDVDVGITAPTHMLETITTSLVSVVLKFLRLRIHKMRA